MITLVNLTKKYGSLIAVNDLNIEIPAGQFFGFLGPNGAGKTTTIKMMTGLFEPSKGEIFIDKININKNPLDAKMSIGYIPDQPFIYDKLTGREYMFFCSGLYKIERSLAETRISELINLFELKPWIDKRSENFSQGMKQRLIIATGLIHQPKVVIIDEPMIGLDPRSAGLVKEVLKDKSKNGTTVFMSTHILQLAEELCDRIVIIKEGKIIFDLLHNQLSDTKMKFGGNFERLFLELTS